MKSGRGFAKPNLADTSYDAKTNPATSGSVRIRRGNGFGQIAYPGATLADLREAVTTLEETERTARRVLGGAHPRTVGLVGCLREARVVLRTREAGKKVVFVRE